MKHSIRFLPVMALLLCLLGCAAPNGQTPPPLSLPAAPAEPLSIPPGEEPANLRCLLNPDGTLLCWDESGETENWRLNLPEGTVIPISEIPTLLSEGIIEAAVGRAHVVFLKDDGSVWTFGENFAGQIGNGTAGTRFLETPSLPTAALPEPSPDNYALEPVLILEDCVAVAAGNSVCAALSSDGTLYTWGDNSCGQIGNGERGNGFPTISDLQVLSPYPVLEGITSISFHLSTESFEAVTADGTRYVWGGSYPDSPTLQTS